MGKYSKVIKKVEFGWRLADNGWADTYCKNCGWTENHDVHVGCDYKFCPGCGGSVEGDRMKYDVKHVQKRALVTCDGVNGCGAVLGYYDDVNVAKMNFCPDCGNKFEKGNLQQLIEEIEV